MRLGEFGVAVLQEVGGDQVLCDAVGGLLAQPAQLLPELLVEFATGDAFGDPGLEGAIGASFLAGARGATILGPAARAAAVVPVRAIVATVRAGVPPPTVRAGVPPVAAGTGTGAATVSAIRFAVPAVRAALLALPTVRTTVLALPAVRAAVLALPAVRTITRALPPVGTASLRASAIRAKPISIRSVRTLRRPTSATLISSTSRAIAGGAGAGPRLPAAIRGPGAGRGGALIAPLVAPARPAVPAVAVAVAVLSHVNRPSLVVSPYALVESPA
ncbi:hypothetical protein GCM10009625_30140 [Brachybacterium fresconis]